MRLLGISDMAHAMTGYGLDMGYKDCHGTCCDLVCVSKTINGHAMNEHQIRRVPQLCDK